MKWWQKTAICVVIGVMYIVAFRPMRSAMMPFFLSFIDEPALVEAGYRISSSSPVNRVFSGPVGLEMQFKAPFDSFLFMGIIFSVLYGVPLLWIGRIAIAHVFLWSISLFAVVQAGGNPQWLALVDLLARYVNPALTLSVIPLWIFERNRRNKKA